MNQTKLKIAKFHSKCNCCGKDIKPGDAIIVDKSARRKKRSFCSGECVTNARLMLDTKSEPIKPNNKAKKKLVSSRDFMGVFA